MIGLELTERRRRILRAIVENYIETAEPVGSRAIMTLAHLDCSSATIRNEMAALEKMGYLEQPHTSAGRIPSPKGYRIYVNELMGEHKLSIQETERINASLNLKMQELDKVIDQAGRLVSQFTNYPSFSLTAGRQSEVISRYDLLMIDQRSFICVAMTSNSQVHNKLFHLPTDLTEPQLQLLNALLNTSFTGKTLEEFSPELMEKARKSAGSSYGLISLVVSFAMDVLKESRQSSVHTAGGNHLLTHQEFHDDMDRAQKLLDYFNGEDRFSSIPMPGEEPGAHTKVLIGPENVAEELKDTSVVLASYDIGDGMKGVIGVVGPTRMDYAQVTAKLSYLADNLSKLFQPQNQLGGVQAPALNPPKEQLQEPASADTTDDTANGKDT